MTENTLTGTIVHTRFRGDNLDLGEPKVALITKVGLITGKELILEQ